MLKITEENKENKENKAQSRMSQITSLECEGTEIFIVDPSHSVPEILEAQIIHRLEQSGYTLEPASRNEIKVICRCARSLFYVSITRFTDITCPTGAEVRYNPLEQRIGVPLQWEVKTLFQVKKKKKNVSYAFIVPGDARVTGEEMRNTNAGSLEKGLRQGRVTPVSIDWMMQELGKRGEMTIFYDEDDFKDLPYITNNIASNTLSLTMTSSDYLAMMRAVSFHRVVVGPALTTD